MTRVSCPCSTPSSETAGRCSTPPIPDRCRRLPGKSLPSGVDKFNVVVLDHTFGLKDRSTGHNNADQFVETVERLRASGAPGRGLPDLRPPPRAPQQSRSRDALPATPPVAATKSPTTASRFGSDLVASATFAGRWDRWHRNARRTSGWGGLLYVVPALVILLIFEIWPLIFGFWISLWRWDIGPIRFIGLDNYVRLFGEGFVTTDFRGDRVAGEVAQSLMVTLYYVVGTVPVTLFLAFGCRLSPLSGDRRSRRAADHLFPALRHQQRRSGARLLLDVQLSGRGGERRAGAGRLADLDLATRSGTGAGAACWAGSGVSEADLKAWPDLAAGPSVALVVVILFSIWTNLGYSVVVYLAGMTAIPRDLRDAAPGRRRRALADGALSRLAVARADDGLPGHLQHHHGFPGVHADLHPDAQRRHGAGGGRRAARHDARRSRSPSSATSTSGPTASASPRRCRSSSSRSCSA